MESPTHVIRTIEHVPIAKYVISTIQRGAVDRSYVIMTIENATVDMSYVIMTIE